MAGYITFLKYTQQGLSTIKDSPGRITAAKAAWEKQGVKVVGVWVTMGEHDLVVVLDAPDDQIVAALALGLAKVGNVTTTTVRAFSEDEFSSIVAKLP